MLSLRDSSSLAFCSRFWGEVYIVRLTYAAGDGAEANTQTGAFQPSSLIRPMLV